MANFGWSYPAGCDGTPFDEADGCDCCGREVGQCICPECPTCGVQGEPDCYRIHGLSYSRDQKVGQAEMRREMGERICDVNVESATYIGDDIDGCYVSVAEGPDGWYTSVSIDSETGSFVDGLTQDDGPYKTEAEAREAGCDAAREWCVENEVDYEGNGGSKAL